MNDSNDIQEDLSNQVTGPSNQALEKGGKMLLRFLIAAQCIPTAGTCPAPLAQNNTMGLSSNCPGPTLGQAVPHSRATSLLALSMGLC